MDEGDAGPTEICSHEECMCCHPGINCLVLFTLYGMNLQYFYRPQGKVMFSEASVCSRGGGYDVTSIRWSHVLSMGVCLLAEETVYSRGGGSAYYGRDGVCLLETPPAVTSSGNHCSSQYAFYWNAFLFQWLISLITVKLLFEHCYAFSLKYALLKILR